MRNRERILLFGAFAMLGIAVALAFSLAIEEVVFGSEPSTEELSERAENACGPDRTVSIDYHPAGFVRAETFVTVCDPLGSSVYVVVTK